MSTQIDLLTGLPMVFDNIIEQIPLDAQIFPYADLGATARPTAPPLYPDSIIPVSAFLSGQHPDTGSAQTVETDGDHNLRVHVANSSGGGSGLYENAEDLTLIDSRESSFGLNDMWTIANADLPGLFLASVSVSVEIDWQAPPPASGHTNFHLYYSYGAFNCWIMHGNISYGIPSAGYGNTTWSGIWSPPVPIALHNAVLPDADCQFVYTSDGNVDLRVSSNFTILKAHV